ncbi:MAG TPA: ABC transporter ATP-binding protein, partial [Anaerolineales bacterium]|nr:ABC transporter ATP-binding protein [Anaerolineales bacterium]
MGNQLPGELAPERKIKIRIERIDFSYSDNTKDQKVIDDFNLNVFDQEFISIVGASGCGKSTLLNIIAGLLPPTHGKVWLDGELVTKPGQDRAMVFQDDAVFPWYTVRQNVEYGLNTQDLKPNERKAIGDQVLELVGLTEAQHLFPRQLSGGMRKRVDVARALAIKPEVLLMDEPFAALDVLTKGKLQEEFLNIWNDNRMTVVFVTHDLEEAIYLSDRVVVMSNHPGRVRRVVEVPFARPRDSDLKT